MNEELYHYGVPGMKWGKRKKIESTGEGIASRQKRPSSGVNSNTSKKSRKVSKSTQAQRTKNGKKKTQKVLQKGVQVTAKTVNWGAQCALRLMQNNVVYGASGAFFDHVYNR